MSLKPRNAAERTAQHSVALRTRHRHLRRLLQALQQLVERQLLVRAQAQGALHRLGTGVEHLLAPLRAPA